jgi:hypothetical protein
MKTPNFTTRIPLDVLETFREAADIWADRQREKEYLSGGETRNLTRWMLNVLIEAANREIQERGNL